MTDIKKGGARNRKKRKKEEIYQGTRNGCGVKERKKDM